MSEQTRYQHIVLTRHKDDLPDPNNEALNKLYTNIFYRMCSNSLTEDGVMVLQFTSPYYATKNSLSKPQLIQYYSEAVRNWE